VAIFWLDPLTGRQNRLTGYETDVHSRTVSGRTGDLAMSLLNLAALERSSRRPRQGTAQRQQMTADVLGRVIACAWRVGGGNDAATVLTPGTLSARILAHLESLPDELRTVLHIDHRVDGDEIEEASQLLVGAQSVGVLGRLNPAHTTAVVRADALQAYALLDAYEAEFPAIVAWARKVAQG